MTTHAIADAGLYSVCLAIQNLWLAATAEELGVGWVSYYRPEDLRALLGIPERVDPIAYLCLGWPDERPQRPGLEAAGWSVVVVPASAAPEDAWAQLGSGARAAGAVR